MKMSSRVERAQRIMAIAVMSFAGLAYAQEQDPTHRDAGPRGGFQRGQFDPAQMQEMMLQRLQRVLAMEDDEWQIVSPLLAKVMQSQVRSRMGGMPFGRRGAFRGGPAWGGRDGAGQDRPPRDGGEGEVQNRPPREGRGARPGGPGRGGFWPQPSPEIVALNEALEAEDTAPDQIRAKMAAARTARVRQGLQLKKAREELRELLTVRQEARLFSMGLLD